MLIDVLKSKGITYSISNSGSYTISYNKGIGKITHNFSTGGSGISFAVYVYDGSTLKLQTSSSTTLSGSFKITSALKIRISFVYQGSTRINSTLTFSGITLNKTYAFRAVVSNTTSGATQQCYVSDITLVEGTTPKSPSELTAPIIIGNDLLSFSGFSSIYTSINNPTQALTYTSGIAGVYGGCKFTGTKKAGVYQIVGQPFAYLLMPASRNYTNGQAVLYADIDTTRAGLATNQIL